MLRADRQRKTRWTLPGIGPSLKSRRSWALVTAKYKVKGSARESARPGPTQLFNRFGHEFDCTTWPRRLERRPTTRLGPKGQSTQLSIFIPGLVLPQASHPPRPVHAADLRSPVAVAGPLEGAARPNRIYRPTQIYTGSFPAESWVPPGCPKCRGWRFNVLPCTGSPIRQLTLW